MILFFPFFCIFLYFFPPIFVPLHLIFFLQFNPYFTSDWTSSSSSHTPSAPPTPHPPQYGIRYPPPTYPPPPLLSFSLYGNSTATQPSGTALEHAGTLIKTGPPGACKMAAGLNRKQSQSNRKSLLSDSGPGLPGFLSGSRQ